jgi:hypothetical protein
MREQIKILNKKMDLSGVEKKIDTNVEQARELYRRDQEEKKIRELSDKKVKDTYAEALAKKKAEEAAKKEAEIKK